MAVILMIALFHISQKIFKKSQKPKGRLNYEVIV